MVAFSWLESQTVLTEKVIMSFTVENDLLFGVKLAVKLTWLERLRFWGRHWGWQQFYCFKQLVVDWDLIGFWVIAGLSIEGTLYFSSLYVFELSSALRAYTVTACQHPWLFLIIVKLIHTQTAFNFFWSWTLPIVFGCIIIVFIISIVFIVSIVFIIFVIPSVIFTLGVLLFLYVLLSLLIIHLPFISFGFLQRLLD